jgi:aminopeptidase N
VPSLLRGFSAPVIVDYGYSDVELALLAGHDADAFNRWEAGQRLAVARLLQLADAIESQQPLALDEDLVRVMRQTLDDDALPAHFKDQALQLPAEAFIAEQRAIVDPDSIRSARQHLRRELGRRLTRAWHKTFESNATPGPYSPEPLAAGKRALKNLALAYLVDSGDAGALELARTQLVNATNITDRQAALACVVNSPAPFKAEVLLQTAREWQTEPLLMNKWFQLQATAIRLPGEPPVLTRVRMLTRHPAYSATNPNNVYALVLAFCANNPAEFHRSDGSGYHFWREQVLQLDRTNPTVAARVARTLDRWRKFTPDRQRLMKTALHEVAGHSALSRDVREIVSKALEN